MSGNENTINEKKSHSSNTVDKKDNDSVNKLKNDLVQPQQTKICDTNEDIDTKNQDEESRECTICYLPLLENTDKVVLEECGHIFHSACIRSWMKQKRTCPYCAGFSLLPEEYPRLI